jgi:hypothetical protein
VALHVHSRYSDGSGTVEQILAAAQGLVDVVWLTDHDGLAARASPGEGRYGSVLLLVGTEMTPPTDHLLVLGTDFVPDREGSWAEAVQAVAQAGGLSFVAHPADPGNAVLRLPSYRWTRREVRGFTGLEVWNHLSQWMRAVHGIGSGVNALAHPLRGAESPDPEVLALWDVLAARERIVGVAGLDAHAVRIPHRRFGFPVFAYRSAFGWMTNRVLVERRLQDATLPEAREMLLAGFREGRVVMVNERRGHAAGIRVEGRTGSQTVALGSEIAWSSDAAVLVTAPLAGFVTMVLGGHVSEPHEVEPGRVLAIPVPKPGAARVEISVREGSHVRPWAYSNPVYFRPPTPRRPRPDA